MAVRSASQRDSSRVSDAGLCHGAAGNAHLFNRLFQATGREEFREAALFWFSHALAMRVNGVGVAGYLTRRAADDGSSTWEADSSFLTGTRGIALAMLAAITDVEPLWDRVLLSTLSHRDELCDEQHKTN